MNINLKKEISFCKAAKIISKKRQSVFFKKIKIYLNDQTIENLHELRISVRRFRYSLENFVICYDKKQIKKVLNTLKKFQDLLGKERDIDVFIERINSASDKNVIMNKDSLLEKLNSEKIKINKKILKE